MYQCECVCGCPPGHMCVRVCMHGSRSTDTSSTGGVFFSAELHINWVIIPSARWPGCVPLFTRECREMGHKATGDNTLQCPEGPVLLWKQ